MPCLSRSDPAGRSPVGGEVTVACQRLLVNTSKYVNIYVPIINASVIVMIIIIFSIFIVRAIISAIVFSVNDIYIVSLL